MLNISKLLRIERPVTVRGLTHDTPMLYVRGALPSAAYASGDTVGQQIAIPLPPGARSGVIVRAVLMDRAKQVTATDLEFFRRPVTQIADNAAFTISDMDHPAHLGTVSLSTFQSYNAEASATLLNVGFEFSLWEGDVLTVQLVTRGTPTLVAIEDYGVAFGMFLDAAP